MVARVAQFVAYAPADTLAARAISHGFWAEGTASLLSVPYVVMGRTVAVLSLAKTGVPNYFAPRDVYAALSVAGPSVIAPSDADLGAQIDLAGHGMAGEARPRHVLGSSPVSLA